MKQKSIYDNELKEAIDKIKEKITNDDILNNILNNNSQAVFEGRTDLEYIFGREIIEIYTKLESLVDNLLEK